jgi:hypothetical protein
MAEMAASERVMRLQEMLAQIRMEVLLAGSGRTHSMGSSLHGIILPTDHRPGQMGQGVDGRARLARPASGGGSVRADGGSALPTWPLGVSRLAPVSDAVRMPLARQQGGLPPCPRRGKHSAGPPTTLTALRLKAHVNA